MLRNSVGHSMAVKFLQLLKLELPIEVTLSGRVISVKPVQP